MIARSNWTPADLLLRKLVWITVLLQGTMNTWVEAATSTTETTTPINDMSTWSPCLSSPCVNSGTCENTDNYGYQCHCPPQTTEGIDVTYYSGWMCQYVHKTIINPVEDVSPVYGPTAGGTNITLTGKFFSKLPPSVAFFGYCGKEVYVNYSSGNTAYFLSPRTTESDIEMLLPIWVIINTTTTRFTPFNFTYRGNPEIGDIYPLGHIISGGTSLTVSGTNLDAVANPILEITQKYTFTVTVGQEKKTNVTFYTSLCHPNSSTTLNCPMPKLDIPDEFLPTAYSQSQNKSAIPPNSGDSTLNFTVGFQLDGYDRYQDVTDELPDKEFTFYVAPSFVTIKDVFVFKPHEPKPIYISGKGFLIGARKNDYNIRLGISNCTIDKVQSNQIICHPNITLPKYHKKDAERCGKEIFAIMVSVGYLEHKVGCLRYELRPPFALLYIILISCGGAVLMCVVFVGCFCYHKRKRGSDENQPDQPGEPNDPKDKGNVSFLRDSYFRPMQPEDGGAGRDYLNPSERISTPSSEGDVSNAVDTEHSTFYHETDHGKVDETVTEGTQVVYANHPSTTRRTDRSLKFANRQTIDKLPD